MSMLDWMVAMWAVASFLYVLMLVQALRWLRSGGSSKGWSPRRLKSRKDAYQAVALTGFAFGLFIQSPVGPWMPLLRASHVNRQLELYFVPMVVLPAILVLIARSVEGTRRVTADVTRA